MKNNSTESTSRHEANRVNNLHYLPMATLFVVIHWSARAALAILDRAWQIQQKCLNWISKTRTENIGTEKDNTSLSHVDKHQTH